VVPGDATCRDGIPGDDAWSACRAPARRNRRNRAMGVRWAAPAWACAGARAGPSASPPARRNRRNRRQGRAPGPAPGRRDHFSNLSPGSLLWRNCRVFGGRRCQIAPCQSGIVPPHAPCRAWIERCEIRFWRHESASLRPDPWKTARTSIRVVEPLGRRNRRPRSCAGLVAAPAPSPTAPAAPQRNLSRPTAPVSARPAAALLEPLSRPARRPQGAEESRERRRGTKAEALPDAGGDGGDKPG
jgi:hypothetical protein